MKNFTLNRALRLWVLGLIPTYAGRVHVLAKITNPGSPGGIQLGTNYCPWLSLPDAVKTFKRHPKMAV